MGQLLDMLTSPEGKVRPSSFHVSSLKSGLVLHINKALPVRWVGSHVDRVTCLTERFRKVDLEINLSSQTRTYNHIVWIPKRLYVLSSSEPALNICTSTWNRLQIVCTVGMLALPAMLLLRSIVKVSNKARKPAVSFISKDGVNVVKHTFKVQKQRTNEGTMPSFIATLPMCLLCWT